MSSIYEIEGLFPFESSCYTSYPASSDQQFVEMVYLPANPRNPGRTPWSVRHFRALDMTSPFAFHPTATLVDLIYQAKTLPQEVYSIDRTLSNSRAQQYGRLDQFLATHPGHVLTNELLWSLSVENDIYIAERNAAIKGIKQKHFKVIERLRRLWAEETERWRQGVSGRKVEGGGKLARRGQVDEWYWRVERVGRWVQKLLEV